jgi:predicted dehydrogenase
MTHITRMPVGVVGAGAIGRIHVEHLRWHPEVALAAVADPGAEARAWCEALGVPWFADHREMLERMSLGAAVVATPNATHAPVAADFLRAGIPTLLEKPICDGVEEARRLCDLAALTGTPLLIGHQRRHNAALQHARDLVQAGALGRVLCATVMANWLKPAEYFEASWRRMKGGGPVLINLIHDVDMVRFLLGEVACVQAMSSNSARGFEVEDTAAVLMRMQSGALITLSVSDACVSPWNWDLSAGEADHYPRQPADAHYICGTQGALTLPHLRMWRYEVTPGWREPLTEHFTPALRCDPYERQFTHLRQVAEGRARPLCSGPDALQTLRAVHGVLEAAATGSTVQISQTGDTCSVRSQII